MADFMLPLDMVVAAQIRTAAREGVPIVVLRRGDTNNGALVIKVNLLDGRAKVFTQIRYEDNLVWCALGKDETMSDTDAERHMAQQAEIDPDSWLIEIEDKQGRLWFPGKVMKF